MSVSQSSGGSYNGVQGADQNVYRLDGDLWVTRITLFCVVCALVVGAADLLLVFFQLSPSEIMARSFNVALEESLGTWFSASQALLVGLVAAAIFLHSSKHDSTFVVLGWAIVALFFIFVSLDDTAKIHERLGTTLRIKSEKMTDIPLSDWFPSWGWQLFVAPLFMIMGVFILFFLWVAVAPGLRVWVLIALGLLSIAVALDFVEGLKLVPAGDYASRHLMHLLEEVLEMLGTTAFLYVFLSTLNSRVKLLLVDDYR